MAHGQKVSPRLPFHIDTRLLTSLQIAFNKKLSTLFLSRRHQSSYLNERFSTIPRAFSSVYCVELRGKGRTFVGQVVESVIHLTSFSQLITTTILRPTQIGVDIHQTQRDNEADWTKNKSVYAHSSSYRSRQIVPSVTLKPVGNLGPSVGGYVRGPMILGKEKVC